MNLSSDEFIQKLKNKDNEALSFIIETYHEALFKGALKQGLGIDQAEEVVQATWYTFFEAVQKFEGRSHIRTYIFGILYNKIKEQWRSNKKYTADDNDLFIEKAFSENGNYLLSPVDPSEWSESQEFNSILAQELKKLPYNQRMAFYLKEIYGESSENICKILDISITNLGVLVYRAKQSLRVRIEKFYTKGER